ncbi:MAG: glycoside hydrolase family 1 protein [Patescibacteria group bacterium]|jgi:beta-glucosidase|nr:glycoside hydrolase family 1 protein [Patescibacteria group bacterium]
MSDKKQILNFPKNFIWGTSTSAYQIEGGITCDWSEWEKKRVKTKEFIDSGNDPDNFICGKACDSYNRYSEDLDLVKELNCGAFRLGIEWARIEPDEFFWNAIEIEHYRALLTEARKKGIKTVVTLWHWTNPVWLSERGGWANPSVIKSYSRYVLKVIEELGGLIDYWVTLNEPLVHVFNGYIIKKFPPQKSSLKEASKVFNNLYKAHNQAYEMIHEIFPYANVSITEITSYYEPARKWNPLEVLMAKTIQYLVNERFLNKIKKHMDYIGIDYYFHDRLVFYPPFRKNRNKEINDMGWEIFPEGIYHVLMQLKKYKLPIFIMENGIPDRTDEKREAFIKDHLKYVHKAIEGGVDVRGYFYWSLLDNFEWAAGFGQKFGLYSVDRKTFERKARPSSRAYAKICLENKIEI